MQSKSSKSICEKTISLARNVAQSLPRPLRTGLQRILSPQYRAEREDARKLESLRSLPRFVGGQIRLEGREWAYADARSFYYAYRAIYKKECFAVRLTKQQPRILDGGAHVGMASRYWKERMPEAEISAIEADANLVPLLRKNLENLQQPPVEVIHGALWKDTKGVEFFAQGADAGFVVQEGEERHAKTVKVPSVTLEEWVGECSVDLLKLDIEGAELEVLRHGITALSWVDRIFVEYHSRVGKPQELADLLEWLREAGFRVWIESEFTARQPFVRQPVSHGMDLQLNISGIKEDLL